MGTGYGQYCPIALAAEIFAERWTPIVLRNLMIGCRRFGEILDGAPGMPRSVLTQRLRRLEHAGVLTTTGAGRARRYQLTAAGHELGEVVLALGTWGARWLHTLPMHYDPALMLWGLAHLIRPLELPRPRVVVRFDITDRSPHRYWILASTADTEVCVTSPGYPDDGVVVTDAHTLYRWHTGRLTLGHAERAGDMHLTGPPWLHRLLAHWGTLSPFAGITPEQPPVTALVAHP